MNYQPAQVQGIQGIVLQLKRNKIITRFIFFPDRKAYPDFELVNPRVFACYESEHQGWLFLHRTYKCKMTEFDVSPRPDKAAIQRTGNQGERQDAYQGLKSGNAVGEQPYGADAAIANGRKGLGRKEKGF